MADLYLLDCRTYTDYLDTFVKPEDVRYLRSSYYCRYLVSLGYRSSMEIYSEPVFNKRKEAIISMLSKQTKRRNLHEGIQITDPVLRELADREIPNIQGTMSTIIYLTHRRKNGFEISGYIDYEESIRQVDCDARGARNWRGIFEGKVKLIPRQTDLSYVDWKNNNFIFFNNSENFIVKNDVGGLKFMYRGDHKMIIVADSKVQRGRTRRTMTQSNKYGYVIFYDYMVHGNQSELIE